MESQLHFQCVAIALLTFCTASALTRILLVGSSPIVRQVDNVKESQHINASEKNKIKLT